MNLPAVIVETYMTREDKLWVDDERNPPGDFWRVCRSSAEAIVELMASEWKEISLDHDLGGEDTGFKVLNWMIEHDVWPTESLTIHTANPPARKRMLQAATIEAPPDLPIYWVVTHMAPMG